MSKTVKNGILIITVVSIQSWLFWISVNFTDDDLHPESLKLLWNASFKMYMYFLPVFLATSIDTAGAFQEDAASVYVLRLSNCMAVWRPLCG